MLIGAPNTGKTTTLNHLFNKLKDDYNGVVVEKCPHDNNQDYFYIINVGKCHIAIATMGDIVYEIKEYLERAKVTNCDWLICANSLKLFPICSIMIFMASVSSVISCFLLSLLIHADNSAVL